jgi:hypothetical protein
MSDLEAPDYDEDPRQLAAALDAVIDEAQDALAEGNVAQAQALLVGAESVSDNLLELLGVPDADDMDAGDTPTSDIMQIGQPGLGTPDESGTFGLPFSQIPEQR